MATLPVVKQDVKLWLTGSRDYTEGVRLYSIYGTSAIIKLQLEAAEHSINRKLLLTELTAIAERVDDELAAPVLTPKPLPVASIAYPIDLEPIIKKRNAVYKEAGALHAIDLWSDDPTTRGTAAKHIIDLMTENGKCWDMIRYFEQHGFLPKEQKGFEYLSDLSPIELLKLRNNNRAYISKTKKKIDAMTEQDAQYRKFVDEIERRTNENIEIEKLGV